MRGRSAVLVLAWTLLASGCSREEGIPGDAQGTPGTPSAAGRPPLRFAARIEVAVRGQPEEVRILDLDGDGRDELLATLRGAGSPENARGALVTWKDVLGDPGAVRTLTLPDYLLGPVPCDFPDGRRLVVASRASSEILWLDPAADPLAVLGRLALEDRPRALASGTLAGSSVVACATQTELLVVDPSGRHGGPQRRPLPEPLTTLVHVAPGAVVVGSQEGGRLWRFDADGEGRIDAEPQAIELAGIPRDLLAVGDAWLVACGDRELVRVDPGGGVTGRRDLGAVPLALRSMGEHVAALTFTDVSYHVLDPATFFDGGPRALRGYAGQDPWDVATGDLDGDGRDDVAFANRGANRVSLLLGGPDGPVEAEHVPTPRGPHRMAVGDLDGDGTREIVAACALADSLATIARTGERRAVVSEWPAPGGADHTVLADVDGDGLPDLAFVAAAPEGGRVVVWRGGTWGPGAPGPPEELALPLPGPVADLAALPRRDGPALLAAALPASGEIAFLGASDGSLVLLERLELRPGPTAPVALAALPREDGSLDLAVALGPAGQRAGLVFLEGGDGVWRETRDVPLPVEVLDLVAFQNDGGGETELAVLATAPGDRNGPGRLAVARRGGSGWEVVHHEATGLRPQTVAAGDVDGDGRDDLVVSAQNSHHVNVYLSADGPPLERTVDLGVGRGVLDVAIADLDGDGREEVLALSNSSSTVSIVRTVSVLPR